MCGPAGGATAADGTGPIGRRPAPDRIRSAALRALADAGGAFDSLGSARSGILRILRREDPGYRLGSVRLRRLLARTPGIGLRVRYAVRRGRPGPDRCPVCGDPLVERINRTLDGTVARVGRRCRYCGFWSGAEPRVPCRYRIVRTGIDGVETPGRDAIRTPPARS
ncbi:MAG: hypothetical protein AAFA34_04010 [Thermoplasmata archaeon]|jgi:ribosomal protein L34E